MKKIIYSFIAVLAITVASSCQKYIDVNTNPNAPTTADASALLPPMLSGVVRGIWYDSRFVGQYAQMWGSSLVGNVWDEEGYAYSSDSGGEIWRSVYFSLGQNVGLMWAAATPKQQYDYIGVGWALRAWGWQTGGDEYNNMIVKEAYDGSRLTFDYDTPDYVYAEAAKDAKTALNYLNLAIATDKLPVSTSLAKGDIMYYGDRTKWIKFCYAILAQNALHISNKASFSPANVIKYCDSSFVSNGDNASVKCNGIVSGDSNFWGPTRQNLGSYKQSDFMVRLLDGRIFIGSATQNVTIDPRLPQLLAPSKDGVYRGVIGANGDPNSAVATQFIPYLFYSTPAAAAVSYPATGLGNSQKYIYNDNSRGVIMTYAETQFFKAEAQFKQNNLTGSLATYQNAIGASIDFVSNPPSVDALAGTQNYIPASAKAAYLASACVKQTTTNFGISDIMQQKFISLFVWGNIEAWCDIRRYGYDPTIYQGYQVPTAPNGVFPDNGGKQVYVLRPRYNSEYIWDIPALQAIGALAPDYHTTKPWFILP